MRGVSTCQDLTWCENRPCHALPPTPRHGRMWHDLMKRVRAAMKTVGLLISATLMSASSMSCALAQDTVGNGSQGLPSQLSSGSYGPGFYSPGLIGQGLTAPVLTVLVLTIQALERPLVRRPLLTTLTLAVAPLAPSRHQLSPLNKDRARRRWVRDMWQKAPLSATTRIRPSPAAVVEGGAYRR
jgi:hypothetical protein